jgi:hypothetical protein
VLSGQKRVTFRRSRHGQKGDRFRVQDRLFELDDVRQIPLGFAITAYRPLTGRATDQDVIDAIERAYGMKHPPVLEQLWWLHAFREVV